MKHLRLKVPQIDHHKTDKFNLISTLKKNDLIIIYIFDFVTSEPVLE